MLLVLPVLRAGASCRYRLRLGPQPTHMVTGSTRARPLRLRVRACRCYAYRTKNPPLYVQVDVRLRGRINHVPRNKAGELKLRVNISAQTPNAKPL